MRIYRFYIPLSKPLILRILAFLVTQAPKSYSLFPDFMYNLINDPFPGTPIPSSR
jgi:hypothetical protein